MSSASGAEGLDCSSIALGSACVPCAASCMSAPRAMPGRQWPFLHFSAAWHDLTQAASTALAARSTIDPPLPSTVWGFSAWRCRLATRYDLVVTTYATLNADFGQGARGGGGGGNGKKGKQPLPVGGASSLDGSVPRLLAGFPCRGVLGLVGKGATGGASAPVPACPCSSRSLELVCFSWRGRGSQVGFPSASFAEQPVPVLPPVPAGGERPQHK